MRVVQKYSQGVRRAQSRAAAIAEVVKSQRLMADYIGRRRGIGVSFMGQA